ncbi:MAG: MarR family winged helix-turn-helix transcriptional regulator [Syntrophobacteraceae bacterium]
MFHSSEECAKVLLETVPGVMRAIRNEMRAHRESGLTVPQFRVLLYLSRNDGASLSEVAVHLGQTLAATSKMIDALVSRALVSRDRDALDRRRVVLAATEHGRASTLAARKAAQPRLAERLSQLSAYDLSMVSEALRALGELFSADPKLEAGKKARYANPGNR